MISAARYGSDPSSVEVVIPTIGRPSLTALLESIATSAGPPPRRIVLVDDRPGTPTPSVPGQLPSTIAHLVEVISSGGRGPAAARNAGWRRTRATWVAFLDDDVVVPRDWLHLLGEDLRSAAADVAGVQGGIRVPLPPDRRPTDWERNVAGLARARWATADMAYRRRALAAVGGFDERFPRAYREDADLGLRVTAAGWRIIAGRRHVVHPVRPAGATVSVAVQVGNAEDPFMRALHGRGWRSRAGVPRGRRPWHLATVAAAGTAALARATGRRRTGRAATLLWAALTADFTRRRITPGPRGAAEVGRMVVTSTAIPFVAVWHLLRGRLVVRGRLAQPGPRRMPGAVLFDRDGTLVHDVAYNGDPALVAPVEGAREVVAHLRRAGVATGVVTNQSGVARGLLDLAQVAAVNQRIDALLGPFDVWQICPHGPDEGCPCRKPGPAMIQRAAAALGLAPEDCVVIGDIGSDVEAAIAAGARPILVPTAVTRSEEIRAAPEVAPDLATALRMAMGGAWA